MIMIRVNAGTYNQLGNRGRERRGTTNTNIWKSTGRYCNNSSMKIKQTARKFMRTAIK
jgi:hypothetical protein